MTWKHNYCTKLLILVVNFFPLLKISSQFTDEKTLVFYYVLSYLQKNYEIWHETEELIWPHVKIGQGKLRKVRNSFCF